MTPCTPSAAVRYASAMRRRAVSSPSGQLCPTTIGKSQVTSLGISMPTRCPSVSLGNARGVALVGALVRVCGLVDALADVVERRRQVLEGVAGGLGVRHVLLGERLAGLVAAPALALTAEGRVERLEDAVERVGRRAE